MRSARALLTDSISSRRPWLPRDFDSRVGSPAHSKRNRGCIEAFVNVILLFLFLTTMTGVGVEASNPLTKSFETVSPNLNRDSGVRLTPLPAWTAHTTIQEMNLGGDWFWKSPWSPTDLSPDVRTNGWAQVQIPSEYERKGLAISNVAGLVRTFSVPNEWRDSRIKIRFDAVNNDIILKINGKIVGSHDGFLLPFEFDITDYVEFERPNLLLMELRENGIAARLAERLRQGGVIRKVTLFSVPKVNLSQIYPETKFDSAYRDATLCVAVRISNDHSSEARKYRLRWELEDPAGNKVDLAVSSMDVPNMPPWSWTNLTLAVRIMDPKKWDPEHPRLYRLKTVLEGPDGDVEAVSRRVGFRQIEIVGDQIKLNGSPIKIRGIVRFDQYENDGSAVPERVDAADPVIFRNANCNYLRSWPSSDSFYDSCDQAGVLVQGDLPISFQKEVPAGSSSDFIRIADEVLAHQRHHPSVIMWSVGNESIWTQPFSDVSRHIREKDPTRPILACWPFGEPDWSLLNLDSIHYPLQDMNVYSNRFRPILFTEYHCVNTYNRVEHTVDPGVREYWGEAFRRMWEGMYSASSVAGGCVFAGVDYFDGQYGDLAWGVVDRMRRPKPEYWHLKKVYSPVHLLDEVARIEPDLGVIRVAVENRQDFSNLSELITEWSLGGRSGRLDPNVPQRSRSYLEVPYTAGDTSTELRLRFLDRRGFLVDEYRLPVGTVRVGSVWRKPSGGVARLLRTGPASLKIETDSASWSLDEGTGRITSGRWNGIEVLKGGPDLWMTDLVAQGWPGWHVESRQEGDQVRIQVSTDSPTGVRSGLSPFGITGTLVYRFDGVGNLDVQYDLKWNAQFSWWYRELGMAFSLAADYDHLRWDRVATWSSYPKGHIGRAGGLARRFRNPAGPAEIPVDPRWPWFLDETNGTADFRSTKYRVLHAALTRSNHSGVLLDSDGSQHVRAVLDGNAGLRMVVNEISGIGFEGFLNRVFPDEIFLMRSGDRFSGRVRLALGELDSAVEEEPVEDFARPDFRLIPNGGRSFRIRSGPQLHLQPRVIRSTNLVDWSPATNAFFLDGDEIEVQIPERDSGSHEFYRAQP